MADAYEFGRVKKKRIFRKIEKEFDNFETDNMKSPISTYAKQSPSSRFKSSHLSLNSYEDQPNNFHTNNYWEKRSNRHYHGETEYRGGGYGGKAWRYYDSSKEGYRSDTGRPPGAEDFTPPPESSAIVTPVILTREKSTVEVKTLTPSLQLKENEIPPPPPDPAPTQAPVTPATPARQYQIASKPNVLEAVVPEQEMTTSVKLLDDSLLLGEDITPYLLDQNHFFVIAVVGFQGCGKSTIASLLADPLKGLRFTSTRSWPFRPETRDQVLRGCHSTSGVDAFVTKDRLVILDLQPLLSPSVMDYIVTQERKASLDYSSSTENLLEVESLQLLTFAMSVSHVLLVVQDYILHPNIVRLLHTCQMMKPSHSSVTSSSNNHSVSSGLTGNRSSTHFDGSDCQQYFPHLVFVHNRAFPHHFHPKGIEELQTFYQATMCDSSMCLESQIGMCSGTFSPPLSAFSSNLNLNLFLIPDYDLQDKCPVSFMESVQEMRRQLFSLSRCPLTHVTLTEKSWYQYACRMWENIRKSNLYVEYSRLLP